MSRLEDHSISIYDAIKKIESGKYVMPAFQRQYVWSMDKIEKLWDSILQGYPISTFLFWHVDNNNVSSDTKFCDFMKEITFDSSKNAKDINYDLRNIDFSISDTAVLDGQQRLTSLFISLLGETGLRQKHQRKTNTTKVVTKLLIELNKNKINAQNEFDTKKYGIHFTDKVGKIEPSQFEIKTILKEEFKNTETRENAIKEKIKFIPQDSKDYAMEVLNLLCSKVFDEKLIRYTELFDMNSDDALEMFVRFNAGGVQLKKSDITMSILVNYWKEAKTKFGEALVGDYASFGTEFLIRTAHMIYGDVVKSNISKQVADDLKNNWEYFKQTLNNTAKLIKSLNISITKFSNSWNILVPIIFTIYYNPNYMNCIDGIKAYIYRASFFTFFSSGTTGKLQMMKNALYSYDYVMCTEMLDQIYELKVNDNKIEELLNYEKGSRVAGEILYYISTDWIKAGPKYEQDHLHPEERFSQSQPSGVSMQKWAEWRVMRNKLPNLQYLEGRENGSKNDMPLQQYFDEMNSQQQADFKKNAYIPENQSLDIANFENFYNERKKLLKAKIASLLG